jgi:hypothetical protein
MHFVEYFRGETALDSCHAPFSFRPLVPFTASLLSFKPMTSINIVNSFSIILAVIFIWFTLKKLGFAFEYRIIGGLLFTISFPTLYYSTTGYIDATATMFLFAIVFTRVKGADWALIPLMILAALTKETSIVLFPFLLLHLYLSSQKGEAKFRLRIFFDMLRLPESKENRRSYYLIWLSLPLYFAAVIYARKTFGGFGDGSGFVWFPNSENLADNVYRAKTYISFIISLGFPGLLAGLYILKNLKSEKNIIIFAFTIAISFSLLLWVYSYFSAYADGRFIWTAYPFMIPLAVRYLSLKYHLNET